MNHAEYKRLWTKVCCVWRTTQEWSAPPPIKFSLLLTFSPPTPAVRLPGSAREVIIGMWSHHRDADRVRERKCVHRGHSAQWQICDTEGMRQTQPVLCSRNLWVSLVRQCDVSVYVWFVHAGVTLFHKWGNWIWIFSCSCQTEKNRQLE